MYLSSKHCLTPHITYGLQRHAVSQSQCLAYQMTEGSLGLEAELVIARVGWEADIQIAWL